ncbi:MAG: hypothetical protein RLZZ69_3335, partial [Cyanobacteriota bacterium]
VDYQISYLIIFSTFTFKNDTIEIDITGDFVQARLNWDAIANFLKVIICYLTLLV